MVIYLRKNKIILKIILLILLLTIIIGGSYLFNYMQYNNYDLIEVSTLKTQNQILKDELSKIENIPKYNSDYLIGRVILRDIHNFYKEIVINVGNDKVSIGDIVVNEEGLVGIISEVKKDISYVKLIDSGYNISVKIGNTYGNLNGNKIDLLDKYSELTAGDIIYTSGITNVPEGIYVGKIKEIKMDNDNLGKEIIVDLVDNRNLIYVGIIKSIK